LLVVTQRMFKNKNVSTVRLLKLCFKGNLSSLNSIHQPVAVLLLQLAAGIPCQAQPMITADVSANLNPATLLAGMLTHDLQE